MLWYMAQNENLMVYNGMFYMLLLLLLLLYLLVRLRPFVHMWVWSWSHIYLEPKFSYTIRLEASSKEIYFHLSHKR
jgi:hypothetical protein